MGSHVFQFVLQLFVGGFELFFGGDTIDYQFGLDVILGANLAPVTVSNHAVLDNKETRVNLPRISRRHTIRSMARGG